MLFAHGVGATFSNLPTVLKQACILITTAFIKMRGDASTTMAYTTSPAGNIPGSVRYGSDIAMALDMVNKYRRVQLMTAVPTLTGRNAVRKTLSLFLANLAYSQC
jgi:hypothetical protein